MADMAADKKNDKTPESGGEPENTAPNLAEDAGGDAVCDIEDVLNLTVDIISSPLFILVTLMAYIAECGGREIPVEQKAEFVTILRKHVIKEDITEAELHLMVRDAFKQTLRIEFNTYLDTVTPNLSMYLRDISVIGSSPMLPYVFGFNFVSSPHASLW